MVKPIIVANWKMNPQTLAEAKKIFNPVIKGIRGGKKVETVICAPFVFLPLLKVKGAQDCFWEERGALNFCPEKSRESIHCGCRISTKAF